MEYTTVAQKTEHTLKLTEAKNQSEAMANKRVFLRNV